MNKLVYSLLFLVGTMYAMDEKEKATLLDTVKIMSKKEIEQGLITSFTTQAQPILEHQPVKIEWPRSPERISLFSSADIREKHKTKHNR